MMIPMDKEAIMMAKYYLTAYAEILWFRGESEAARGNDNRMSSLHSEYHQVHNVIKKLEATTV